MTWTALATIADGQLITASWLNNLVTDLLETAPAKATTAGYHFASSGVNSVAERAILGAGVLTSENTASTTYTNLATTGPSVTATTGPQALVWLTAQAFNSGANQNHAGLNVTGATTSGPLQSQSIIFDFGVGTSPRMGITILQICTAGSNTFQMQYKTVAGTATFGARSIAVMAL
jgi:hypothetical protein